MAVFLSLTSGVTDAGRDTPVLGYWSIRGLAEPIRLLHAYVGKPLEEHRWGRLGSRPHVNRDVFKWLAFKRELEADGLGLPNMPYYIDGELRLTESAAILRYVCEKHQPALLQPEGGRCGTTTARALHDQLFVFLLNHNAATRAFHYGYLPQTNLRASKEKTGRTGSLTIEHAHSDETRAHMGALAKEQILDAIDAARRGPAFVEGGALLFGAATTAADFLLYEHVQLCRCHCPELIELAEVRRFCDAFELLPGVADYLKSASRVSVPINVGTRYGGSTDPAAPFAVAPPRPPPSL